MKVQIHNLLITNMVQRYSQNYIILALLLLFIFPADGQNHMVIDQSSPAIEANNLIPVEYTVIGSLGSGNGQFENPRNIYVNDTHFLVVDTGNDRVQIFDLSGNFVSSFGEEGSDPGQFNSPTGIASNGTHYFVTDTTNAEIVIFDLAGNYVHTLETFGITNDTIYQPLDISSNGTHIFVADAISEKINIHKTNGDYVRSFPIQEEDDLNIPKYVDINTTHIFVSVNNKIQIYDHFGNYIKSLNSSKSFDVAGTTLFNNYLLTVNSLSGIIEIFENDGDYIGSFGDISPSNVEMGDLRSIASNTSHLFISDNFADHVYIIEVNSTTLTPAISEINSVPNGIEIILDPGELSDLQYVDLNGYNIYRLEDNSYELLQHVEGSALFVDTDVTDGETYEYVITGVLTSGETQSSPPQSIMYEVVEDTGTSETAEEDTSDTTSQLDVKIGIVSVVFIIIPLFIRRWKLV